MSSKKINRVLILTIAVTAVAGIFTISKITFAQNNINSLTGVYGCTMRDDRWGQTPSANSQYDVSALVWILDATNKKVSGIDMRYTFEGTGGSLGSIKREADKLYKDETAKIEATELMNVYKMTVDEDGYAYLVATNGGNTLLVSEASSNNRVSASGICQKM